MDGHRALITCHPCVVMLWPTLVVKMQRLWSTAGMSFTTLSLHVSRLHPPKNEWSHDAGCCVIEHRCCSPQIVLSQESGCSGFLLLKLWRSLAQDAELLSFIIYHSSSRVQICVCSSHVDSVQEKRKNNDNISPPVQHCVCVCACRDIITKDVEGRSGTVR